MDQMIILEDPLKICTLITMIIHLILTGVPSIRYARYATYRRIVISKINWRAGRVMKNYSNRIHVNPHNPHPCDSQPPLRPQYNAYNARRGPQGKSRPFWNPRPFENSKPNFQNRNFGNGPQSNRFSNTYTTQPLNAERARFPDPRSNDTPRQGPFQGHRQSNLTTHPPPLMSVPTRPPRQQVMTTMRTSIDCSSYTLSTIREIQSSPKMIPLRQREIPQLTFHVG